MIWATMITGGGASAASLKPQSGIWSPEWVVDTRFVGDQYIDTNTGVTYTNPNLSGNVGWEVVQTAPAIPLGS